MVPRLHLRELLVLELELRDEGCTQQLQLAKLLLEPAHPRLECVGLGLGCRLPPAARAPPPAPSGLATPSHSRTTHFPFPLTTDPNPNPDPNPDPHQVSELNPHLGETLHEVFQLLAATLLRINRLAYVAPCLLQARALHAKLKQVQLAAVGMSEGQLSEIEEEIALKAATLAAALAVERHYVRQADARDSGGPMSPLAAAAAAVRTRAQLEDLSAGGLSYDPRYLIFEFTTSIILRETQVRLVEKFVGTLTEGKSLVSQLIMGAGKTTTIAPLLALLIADGSQLVVQVTAPPAAAHPTVTLLTTALSTMQVVPPYYGSTYHSAIYYAGGATRALLTFSRAVLRCASASPPSSPSPSTRSPSSGPSM